MPGKPDALADLDGFLDIGVPGNGAVAIAEGQGLGGRRQAQAEAPAIAAEVWMKWRRVNVMGPSGIFWLRQDWHGTAALSCPKSHVAVNQKRLLDVDSGRKLPK